jgi:hypothetical protein
VDDDRPGSSTPQRLSDRPHLDIIAIGFRETLKQLVEIVIILWQLGGLSEL